MPHLSRCETGLAYKRVPRRISDYRLDDSSVIFEERWAPSKVTRVCGSAITFDVIFALARYARGLLSLQGPGGLKM